MRTIIHKATCRVRLFVSEWNGYMDSDIIEIDGAPYAILEHREESVVAVPVSHDDIYPLPVEYYFDLTTFGYRSPVSIKDAVEILGIAELAWVKKPLYVVVPQLPGMREFQLDEEPTEKDVEFAKAGRTRLLRLSDRMSLGKTGEWEPLSPNVRLGREEEIVQMAVGVLFPTFAEDQWHEHPMEVRSLGRTSPRLFPKVELPH